ncbi:MarR family transcriptional regulator [Phenylobacterium sp. LjRoot225]|uniref:MarR family winged helix-turn-helix transcriptional regulator n=1 Tax=Phenylobacterium sp. LjRoot225 TaxID=3342285 RepID=UPI003ED16A28
MRQRPVDELEAATAFYAELDLDVSYFAAQWHTFNVGHMLATDLDRIARRNGLSVADLHLLGALRIKRPKPLRATDLAQTLHVSNAVLSARIAKLERNGLLVRSPSQEDRRAFVLSLTSEGAAKAVAVVAEMGRESTFVRYYKRLSDEDRAALARIMGELHNMLDREFVPAPRGKL